MIIGKHEILVKKERYHTWQKEVSIEENRKASITAQLTPEPASLNVIVVGSWGTVFLDGRELGFSNRTYNNIQPGNHKLEVYRDKNLIHSSDIYLEPGSFKKIKINK